MNARTQIYLTEQQRLALKLLCAASDQSVSDVVRRAVDRLLSDELGSDDWGSRLDALAERVRSHGSEPSAEDVAGAVARSRRKRVVSV
jgi:Arc/MetJ-type ribon-helix-helix transcriptional regulator